MTVYDVFMYNGEHTQLQLRLYELDPVVDWFVLVEMSTTFSGLCKEYKYVDSWEILRPYARKLRIVHVDDCPSTTDPWIRERHQRDAGLRGCFDADDQDWIIASDVDEIPRRDAVSTAINSTNGCPESSIECFSLELSFRYFYLDYVNTSGPESSLKWSYMARKKLFTEHSFDSLRYKTRSGEVESKAICNAGWHLSWLGNKEQVVQKIKDFSHQEFNNAEFLRTIDIDKLISQRKDLFNRDGFQWDIDTTDDLPCLARENPSRYRHLISAHIYTNRVTRYKKKIFSRINYISKFLARHSIGFASNSHHAYNNSDPLIIVPYISDDDLEQMKHKFDFEGHPEIPVFFWKDVEQVGPERAYQACWERFRDRDIVILHTDMEPLPNEESFDWYKALVKYRNILPDAGAIACNLLYPDFENNPMKAVQCAGGLIDNSANISHIHHTEYSQSLNRLRKVDWVTFGGILLKRIAIDACGGFDTRYEWAYIMDVDYSLEIRSRGFNLYQIPQALIHHESKSTSAFLAIPRYQQIVKMNHLKFQDKWLESKFLLDTNRG